MNENDFEKQYTRFAGLVHFLDPSRDEEERPLKMDLKSYEDILTRLDEKHEFSTDELADLFKTHPKAIDLFELILQQSNFTTAQRTFLMFDLSRLNSSSVDEALGYILQTLREDEKLRKDFQKEGLFESGLEIDLDRLDDERKHILLADSKRLIATFCEKKDPVRLQQRLNMSAPLRRRAADYLIDKRALNSVLAGVLPRTFLQKKRVPVDSKSAHGKYAITMLKGILESDEFQHRDDLGSCIRRTGHSQKSLADSSAVFSYSTEREVESLSSKGASISGQSATTGKKTAKRFDFVLLYEQEPKVVIETNFYTTSGSKIGINEKEYVALHRHIAQTERGLRFIWITDGSYWLTSTGKDSFFKLAPSFGEDLMNLALFAKSLRSIKQSMSVAAKH